MREILYRRSHFVVTCFILLLD